jgi:glycosyltransferase involved in cell wall biosynthesis
MLAVRDEADILPRNLEWYADFETVVVDNGSTDGSYELCERALEQGTVVALRRLPTERHDIEQLMRAVFELAREQRPDALLLTAPDEFFEVASGGDLRATIEEDFAAGYNIIAFRRMDFVMTRRDDPSDSDPLSRMRYYGCRRGRLQRAYPWIEGLDMVSGLSHRVRFPPSVEARMSPRLFVCRHYPLRTVAQAQRKVRRFAFNPEHPDRSNHYLHYSGEADEFFVDPKDLARYTDDHNWDYSRRLEALRAKQLEAALRWALRHAAELERELEALRAAMPPTRAGS